MARIIVKLEKEGHEPRYMEWCTVADGPTTYGLTREEFEEFYLEEYGRKGLEDLKKRMERTDSTGCSSYVSTRDGLFECHEAPDGPGPGPVTMAQVWEHFVEGAPDAD